MTLSTIRDRLRRIEEARNGRTAVEAIVLTLDSTADAEPLIAARLRATGQQPGRTPVIIVRSTA